MNAKFFRLVFSKRLGMRVPVWEGASVRDGKKSSGKRGRRVCAALAIVSLSAAMPARANPTDPTVTIGQASFGTQGKTLTIINSPNAIINWKAFSIGRDEITRFIQQSPSSAVLNRVVGQDPSSILGALQSNGRVFLINPNGILFGQGARVDVAGLVASSLNLTDQDFLAGRLRFQGTRGAAGVANEGAITTPSGGQVYLVAPKVENNGIITTPQGEIILAAGNSAELVDPATPDVSVQISAPDNQAINVGRLVAQGGNIGIYAGLVQQGGIVSADSAGVNAAGNIVFKATQSTTLAAGSQTSATGSQGKGGAIVVAGNAIAVEKNAGLDASGQSGGGTLLVGGDTHGANAAVPNAQTVTVAAGATLKADAIQAGNGGRVVVWSDDSTRFDGQISARGGVQGGNGGFAEVSGKQHLAISGHADLSAPQGSAGTLLLDPGSVDIVSGANAGPGGAFDSINTGWVAAQLNDFGNVMISTANSTNGATENITVNGAVSWNSANSFSLGAGNNIAVNASIQNNGTGGVNMNAGNAVTLSNGSMVRGGSISITATGAIQNGVDGGSFDTSLSNGTIDLTAASIGASGPGHYITINPGTGIVHATTSSGGIFLEQSAGDVLTSKYTFSAPLGQEINLAAGTGSLTIDNNQNYANNRLAFFTLQPGADIGISAAATVTTSVMVTASDLVLSTEGGGNLNFASGLVTLNTPLWVSGTTATNVFGGTVTLNGDANLQGAFNWSGGTITGSGNITLGGSISMNGVTVLDGRTLTLNGHTTLSGNSQLRVDNGAHLINNGAMDLNGDALVIMFAGTGSTIDNSGSITKSAGGGNSQISATTFNNSGTISVQTGALQMIGGGTHSGTFDVASGATLVIMGGPNTFTDTSQINGAGTINLHTGNSTFNGAWNHTGTITTGGGLVYTDTFNTTNPISIAMLKGTTNTLVFNSPFAAANASVTGSNISGSGNISFGNLIWNGGIESGTGATTVSGSLSMNGATVLNGRTLTLDGPSTLSGISQLRVDNGAHLINNGAMDLAGDALVIMFSGTGSIIDNAGSITKSAGTGNSMIGATTLNNSGTISAQTGIVSVLGSGTHSGGFDVASGATLRLAGIAASDTQTFTQTSQINGAGTVFLGVGSNTFNGAWNHTGAITTGGGVPAIDTFNTMNPVNIASLSATSNSFVINSPFTAASASLNGSRVTTTAPVTFGTVAWGNANLSGSGGYTVTGDMSINAAGGPTLTGATLTAQGATTLTGPAGLGNGGSMRLNDGARFINQGTFNIVDDVYIVQNAAGADSSFINRGLLTMSVAGGSAGFGSTTAAAMNFSNAGTVTAGGGSLNFGSGYTQTAGATVLKGGSIGVTGVLQINGGTLGGSGSITGNVNNASGNVGPGFSPGTINITGNYTQGSDGMLAIELGGLAAGTQYDVLNVGGSVVLGGTLNVSYYGSFTAAAADSFTPINGASVTGTFAAVNVPPVPGLSVTYGPASVRLAAAPTPPPPVVVALPPPPPTTPQTPDVVPPPAPPMAPVPESVPDLRQAAPAYTTPGQYAAGQTSLDDIGRAILAGADPSLITEPSAAGPTKEELSDETRLICK